MIWALWLNWLGPIYVTVRQHIYLKCYHIESWAIIAILSEIETYVKTELSTLKIESNQSILHVEIRLMFWLMRLVFKILTSK